MLHLRKENGKLIPVDNESLELIKKLPLDVLSCNIKRTRNYNFHKKFFAMLKIGLENTKLVNMNAESYREYILIKSGHWYTNTMPNYIQFRAKSISFENLSQDKFDELYPIARGHVANDLAITSEKLEEQIMLIF